MSNLNLSNVQKEIVENYESAVFAVVMDSLAAEQGEDFLALNEKLKADKSAEISEKVNKKNFRTIEKAFNKKERRANLRAFKRIANMAAVFVFVLVLASTFLFTTVEAVRVEVLNFVLNFYDYGEGTIIRPAGTTEPGKAANEVVPTWLPYGYALENKEGDDTVTLLTYANSDKNYIYFKKLPIDSTIDIDTENADETSQFLINGNEAILSAKGTNVILLWIDNEKLAMFVLETFNVDKNAIIKIAGSCYK